MLAGGNDRHWSPTTFWRKADYAVQSLPLPIGGLLSDDPQTRNDQPHPVTTHHCSSALNGRSGRGQLIPVLPLKSHSRHASRLSGHVQSGHLRRIFSAHANHLCSPITQKSLAPAAAQSGTLIVDFRP